MLMNIIMKQKEVMGVLRISRLNILRIEAKLLKLGFYEDLKILLVKLYKVSPESLWIGGRRQEFSPAERTEKQSHWFYAPQVKFFAL